MQEQGSNASREMETKEKLKETLEFINTVEEMKDAFD